VCRRMRSRHCQIISRRAMRRGLTKPLARVLGLYTKPRRLAFARLKPAQLFSALLAASRAGVPGSRSGVGIYANALYCNSGKMFCNAENTMNLKQLLRSRGARKGATNDVRFGSVADIASRTRHVRYSHQSGHSSARFARLLCAKSGHLTRLNSPFTAAAFASCRQAPRAWANRCAHRDDKGAARRR
jgi:hypothetical protein